MSDLSSPGAIITALLFAAAYAVVVCHLVKAAFNAPADPE